MKAIKRFAIVLLPLALNLILPPLVSGNGFSLEQVLSSPFPSDLIASKSGDKLAWVFDHKGKRNIWVAEAPAFNGRQLTRYDLWAAILPAGRARVNAPAKKMFEIRGGVASFSWSYGGYLTAMGLARDSDLFAAGVDIHGVHDWSTRVGSAPWATGDLIKLGRVSSPISSVEKWKSPVLLIHGDDDRNVAFSRTVELVRKLRERGLEFEELVFPDDVHDFLRHENWLRVFHAASDFFDRKLRRAQFQN